MHCALLAYFPPCCLGLPEHQSCLFAPLSISLLGCQCLVKITRPPSQALLCYANDYQLSTCLFTQFQQLTTSNHSNADHPMFFCVPKIKFLIWLIPGYCWEWVWCGKIVINMWKDCNDPGKINLGSACSGHCKYHTVMNWTTVKLRRTNGKS